MSLIDICSKYTLDVEQTFCKPCVPNKKAANAIEKYAKGIEISDIIVLVDDTAFGSARDGFILSVQGLYGHEIFSDARIIGLDKIDNIYSIGKDIYVNNEKFISINLINKVTVAHLCKMLMEIVIYLKSEKEKTCVKSESNAKDEKTKLDDRKNTILGNLSFSNPRIHIYPNIPPSKTSNVINSYARGVSHNDILLLYDDTAFGGAKESFVITSDRIYFHELFCDPVCIKFDEIRQVDILNKDIFINKNNVFTPTSLQELEMRKLKILFENIADNYAAQNMSRLDREERQILKECYSSREFSLLNLIWASKDFRKKEKFIHRQKILTFIDRMTLDMNTDKYHLKSSIKINANPIPNTIKSMLIYAFEFQNTYPIDEQPVFEILLMTDAVIHELLLFLIYRGSRIIYKSFFDDEERRAMALSIFAQEAMYSKFFLPFYKYKHFLHTNDNSLLQNTNDNKYEGIFKNILMSRNIYNSDDPEILLTHLRNFILESFSREQLSFNFSGILNAQDDHSNNLSELITQVYMVYSKAIKGGLADDFLNEFIACSENEMFEIVAQLLARRLAD